MEAAASAVDAAVEAAGAVLELPEPPQPAKREIAIIVTRIREITFFIMINSLQMFTVQTRRPDRWSRIP